MGVIFSAKIDVMILEVFAINVIIYAITPDAMMTDIFKSSRLYLGISKNEIIKKEISKKLNPEQDLSIMMSRSLKKYPS